MAMANDPNDPLAQAVMPSAADVQREMRRQRQEELREKKRREDAAAHDDPLAQAVMPSAAEVAKEIPAIEQRQREREAARKAAEIHRRMQEVRERSRQFLATGRTPDTSGVQPAVTTAVASPIIQQQILAEEAAIRATEPTRLQQLRDLALGLTPVVGTYIAAKDLAANWNELSLTQKLAGAGLVGASVAGDVLIVVPGAALATRALRGARVSQTVTTDSVEAFVEAAVRGNTRLGPLGKTDVGTVRTVQFDAAGSAADLKRIQEAVDGVKDAKNVKGLQVTTVPTTKGLEQAADTALEVSKVTGRKKPTTVVIEVEGPLTGGDAARLAKTWDKIVDDAVDAARQAARKTDEARYGPRKGELAVTKTRSEEAAASGVRRTLLRVEVHSVDRTTMTTKQLNAAADEIARLEVGPPPPRRGSLVQWLRQDARYYDEWEIARANARARLKAQYDLGESNDILTESLRKQGIIVQQNKAVIEPALVPLRGRRLTDAADALVAKRVAAVEARTGRPVGPFQRNKLYMQARKELEDTPVPPLKPKRTRTETTVRLSPEEIGRGGGRGRRRDGPRSGGDDSPKPRGSDSPLADVAAKGGVDLHGTSVLGRGPSGALKLSDNLTVTIAPPRRITIPPPKPSRRPRRTTPRRPGDTPRPAVFPSPAPRPGEKPGDGGERQDIPTTDDPTEEETKKVDDKEGASPFPSEDPFPLGTPVFPRVDDDDDDDDVDDIPDEDTQRKKRPDDERFYLPNVQRPAPQPTPRLQPRPTDGKDTETGTARSFQPRRTPQRFLLPPGSGSVAPGRYPRVVRWKQGFEQVTLDLDTGARRFERAKFSGQPSHTFRVIRTDTTVPKAQVFRMGTVTVRVNRSGLRFRANRSTPTSGPFRARGFRAR